MVTKKESPIKSTSKTSEKTTKRTSKKTTKKISKKTGKLHIKKKSSSKLAVKRNKLVRKKQLGLCYQITFSVLLIAFLVMSYFLTIISIDSKEIPFISSKIESSLKGRVGDDVIVGKTHIELTRYGAFKISIEGLKISTLPVNGQKGRNFFAPRIEGEISLLSALMLNFQPKKIKIINPMMITNAMGEKVIKAETGNVIDPSMLAKLLRSIETGAISIENIEIENAKLLLRSKGKNTKFLLKKSLIETSVKEGVGHVISKNTIGFSRANKDVEFDFNCRLSEQGIPQCDVMLENFVAASVANLHPTLNVLHKIEGIFDAKASFSIGQTGELSNIDFKASAEKGNFEFLGFFKQKMEFEDLSIIGFYDHQSRILSLAEINMNFSNYDKVRVEGNEQNSDSQLPKAALNMSLLISNLGNQKEMELGFNIHLKDLPIVKLDRYWPVSLNQKGIRKWVISHVNDGVVKNAQAKFSLTQSSKNNKLYLNEIDAKLSFSGMGVDYSYNFPTIDNLSGNAEFNMKGMKISLASGNVLKSKIFNSEVFIDDFRDPKSTLKIRGHSRGHAADLLKHAGYNSPFSSEIEKYFNGTSVNSFKIDIPLKKAVNLDNTYLSFNSKIKDLTNDYVNGDLLVVGEKKAGMKDFITKITLTDANITTKVFDILKAKGVQSELNFTTAIQGQNQLQLKNIVLSKKETDVIEGKISGDMSFDLSPFAPTKINLKNRFFGNNHYDFSYQYEKNILKKIISLKGPQLNLAALIENKLPFESENSKESSGSFEMHIVANSADMLYDKSIENLYVFLDCLSGICHTVTAKATYNQGQFIHFFTSKESNLGSAKVTGHISDIGYLAEALGISHAISNAPADVSIMNKFVDGKAIIEGDVILQKGVTIYDNAMVKRLSKDTLFSQIKDRIFSNDKTTFNSVKIKFGMNKKVLNIHSLIANNYKIGITAKGHMDLGKGFYNIKGMIVPGFIVNNLFGIGKIPVVGSVVSGLLTGGQGGGVFGIRYEYAKAEGDQKPNFKTKKISSFVPTTIKNLFDLI